jgi:hypothetical protein
MATPTPLTAPKPPPYGPAAGVVCSTCCFLDTTTNFCRIASPLLADNTASSASFVGPTPATHVYTSTAMWPTITNPDQEWCGQWIFRV